MTQPIHFAPRRQARFVPDRVILPQGFEPNRWYDVCQGRRRGDQRPGTVLLAVGTHRVPVPEICLEFRADPPADAPVPKRRRWGRKLALALSVPVGLIAVATVSLIVGDAR